MKLISFSYKDQEGYGLLEGTSVLPFQGQGLADRLEDYLATGPSLEDIHLKRKSAGIQLDLDEVTLLAPLKRPRRNVICLGLNYQDHVTEVSDEIDTDPNAPAHPVYFSKLVDSFTGPGQTLEGTQATGALDYEVELALIIGREGKNIPKEEALDYVLGYTIANDFSARDLQTRHGQWFKGKSLDGFCGLGPYILTSDEFDLAQDPSIQAYVNGEIRQDSSLSHMIFDIATVISDFSKGTTLLPGDIILTGTPSGVGMGFDPPVYLKAGDEVTCKIQGLGQLTNSIL